MVKEENLVDVEEGEISDATSIEEISEEDFKQDVKETKEVSKPKARVWTMEDLYRYQVGKGYTSGLHNLAWAQAVQKKPLNEVVIMELDAAANVKKGDSVKGVEAVVIDDSGDEGDAKVGDGEKEEGELEEGEIDLDSDVVDKVDGEGGEASLSAESVSDGGECEMELGEEEVERRLHLIQEALDSVISSNAEISFEEVCCRLQCCLENLKEVVLVNSLPLKDGLIQLFCVAIQAVHSEFCSMDSSQKEQNKDKISRLLSLVKSNNPSFFSSEQAKEIEDMICYLNALPIWSSANETSNQKNSEYSAGIATNSSAHSSEVCSESLLAELTDQTGRNITLKALKLGNSGAKARGMLLPLLDLHKDHDEDSLPSPTQQAPPSLNTSQAFLSRADGTVKPEMSMSMSMSMGKLAQEAEAFKVHPYETDALNAVSTYQKKFQQKFGGSSFSNDRLPSPTPSEEHENGVDDTSGEVSSSSSRIGNSKIMNAPILGRPVFSSLPHVNNVNMQGVMAPQNHALTSSGSNLPVKSSGKSRDPRLRFTNSDSGNLDLNQRPSPVIHSAPRAELVGGSMITRKQRNSEDPTLDGPATKRVRNGFENSGVLKDVKMGGWLEDSHTGGYQAINRNNPLENASDSKRTDNGLIFPSIDSGKSSVAINGNNLSRVSNINPAAALPALLKDIAVNPTMLMNLLKMGQQQKLAAEAQQSPVDKNMSSPSNSSILGAAPKVTLAPAAAAGSGILQKPTVMPLAPTPVAPMGQQDELGKIRMKPRDPRRVLHGNMLQRTGSMSTEQLKHAPPVLRTQMEDLADRKTMLSESSGASDVSQKILKNSKNVPVIISSSQSSTSPVPGCQNLPSHPIQSTSGVDAKTELPNDKDQRCGTDPLVEVSAPGPSPSQSSWGDLEHIFEGYDDQQKAAIQRERARRMEEQRKMFAARKLCLVLDLDHTLLNSAKFGEVEPVHEEILRKKEEQDRAQPQRHLFRFIHMGMWTKLRPGIWNFLEKASKLYELHLYTMGNKLYATEMAKVLDPTGVLFAGRVISRGDDGDPFDSDDRCPKSKDLEGVLGMESSVVIIDDSVRVWPHNKLNLIVVERYTYFPCSRRQFGLLGPSLLEIDHDERPDDGTLASSLAVIERIHQDFFAHQSFDDVDVRNILATEQQKILAGCRIVFSRIFPVGEANPQLHPLWQTAEQFGATCTNQIDEQVTHVVANSLGTDKVNWALSRGRFVVHPGWVEASALLYRRANEQDFAIKQ
ncbi:RNA polymerase II C-terminal domain phosphatase-like 3 isoform X2 [Rhodamnia argentea]|uniref:protein-serine/threonine phosphatase n=1 Tax=Rhodamnia argentea TaxID=178133 RepID=A0A8B8PXG6_9MYRT|nr:RNA polymerase II C-terminal domain phosphatase-like 3 isoform X2 [Rhodamnia argentea]